MGAIESWAYAVEEWEGSLDKVEVQSYLEEHEDWEEQ